jgi:hypothetical protein
MADPTSDTPMNTPEDVRPRATIKLKPMTPPADAAAGAADAAAAGASAAAGAADAAAQAEPAIHIAPSPAATVPGVKQTIRLRPPTATPVESTASAPEVKPAIKIVPKTAETPTGIPTAKPVESAPAASNPSTIQLKKPESSTPTIQLKKPESSTSTIQLKKPESSTPTIQLKKPESSAPTVQLKKPEQESSAAPAKKVGESPIPPERKLTLKLKNKPSEPKELPRNIIPGLNIPNMPPQAQKQEEQKPEQPAEQPPVAAPVETPTPVPEAVPEDKKKKGKLPKVKKQKAPVTSTDEPNWFFLTLSILTLLCVCFIAYLLFAQYMNMYEGQQIPIPQFLMPK